MREDHKLYERAVARAWQQIEARLSNIAGAVGGKLRLISVQYDPVPGESVIDELPDTAKSSRPQAVKVSVRLRATYSIH